MHLDFNVGDSVEEFCNKNGKKIGDTNIEVPFSMNKKKKDNNSYLIPKNHHKKDIYCCYCAGKHDET